MFLYPPITAALAELYHGDLDTRAEISQLSCAARPSHPGPARHATGPVKIIQRAITALRRAASTESQPSFSLFR